MRGRVPSLPWRGPKAGHRALVTVGTGAHTTFLDITAASRQAYAERHGYTLIERRTPRLRRLPASWEKVHLLRHVLRHHELVFWIDADAVIVDPSHDIADDLGDAALGLVDHRFGDSIVPNTGVMAVRSTRWSRSFFDEVWRLRHRFAEHKWWDNAATLHLLGYSTDEPVRRVAPSAHDAHLASLPERWNAIPQLGGTAPAVVHFPGCPNRYRLDVLRRLAADPSTADEVLAAGPPPPDPDQGSGE